MKDYKEFLNTKEKKHIHSGFDADELNSYLKPFQEFIVKKALSAGKYAIFADTGLGKTIMQLSWAQKVTDHTGDPVLILAPLAVVQQTIDEGEKFGIPVNNWFWSNEESNSSTIFITNYEQIDNIDVSIFSGVVLDESSILKSFDGKTSNKIIETFKLTPYKLACSATPSPNDHTELGMHSEFLDAMSYHEMLAMYFVHDGGETSKWRLRKHAENDFWNFVLSWAIAIDHPRTFGFNEPGYDLPKLNVIEHFVDVESDGLDLFGEAIVSATDLHRDLKKTFDKRIQKALDIISKDPDEDWIVWTLHNDESDHLSKRIFNCGNLKGSDSLLRKKDLSLWFTDNKLWTKKNTIQNTTRNIEIQLSYKQLKEIGIEKGQTKNIEKEKKNIIENTIKNINQHGIKEQIKNEKKGIGKEERSTKTIKHTEKNAKNNQEISVETTRKPDSKENLSQSMGSRLMNTRLCLNPKMELVRFADQNPLFKTINKDYTLTTATKPEELGDYYAQTVIRELENSKILKNCYNVLLDTYGNQTNKSIVTKTKIFGYGINAQNCHNMIFTAYDFSFESIYQAIRRCLRFGQEHEVNVHFLIPKTQTNVRRSFLDKEKKHKERIHNLAVKSYNFQKFEKEYTGNVDMTIPEWLK